MHGGSVWSHGDDDDDEEDDDDDEGLRRTVVQCQTVYAGGEDDDEGDFDEQWSRARLCMLVEMKMMAGERNQTVYAGDVTVHDIGERDAENIRESN
jgi:hypothetical protein